MNKNGTIIRDGAEVTHLHITGSGDYAATELNADGSLSHETYFMSLAEIEALPADFVVDWDHEFETTGLAKEPVEKPVGESSYPPDDDEGLGTEALRKLREGVVGWDIE